MEGAVWQFEGWSVSVILTSNMAVWPRVQKPCTARSPRSSGEGSVQLVPSNGVSRLELMSGSSETVDGVCACPHKLSQVLTISLWRWRIKYYWSMSLPVQ